MFLSPFLLLCVVALLSSPFLIDVAAVFVAVVFSLSSSFLSSCYHCHRFCYCRRCFYFAVVIVVFVAVPPSACRPLPAHSPLAVVPAASSSLLAVALQSEPILSLWRLGIPRAAVEVFHSILSRAFPEVPLHLSRAKQHKTTTTKTNKQTKTKQEKKISLARE